MRQRLDLFLSNDKLKVACFGLLFHGCLVKECRRSSSGGFGNQPDNPSSTASTLSLSSLRVYPSRRCVSIILVA